MTTIFKGRDGWQAEDNIPFEPAGYELRITTMKRSRGISTNVTRVKLDPNDPRVFSFVMFRDYNKTHDEDSKARCTEKTVAAMHAGVMADLDNVKVKVRAFYYIKEFGKPGGA